MERIFWGFQTHFSMGESIIDPDDGIAALKDQGWTHVALADTMSLSALISVSKAAKKHGLEVITGATIRVQSPYDEKVFLKPIIYAHNEQGVKQLFKLLSEVERDFVGAYVSWKQFIEALNTNVTVSTGNAHGMFSHTLTESERNTLLTEIVDHVTARGILIDLPAVPSPAYARYNVEALQYVGLTDYPVAINPVALYEKAPDHDARDVMQGILARRKVTMSTMRWFPNDGRFIKSPAKVEEDFVATMELAVKTLGYKDAVRLPSLGVQRNSLGFDYKWKKQDPAMPQMAPDENKAIREICEARFKDRIERPVFGYQPPTSELPKYHERLEYELGVLERMGFAGYFLLVADLVQWSKDNGIIVGPGRGSVGGSLVAFIMGITEVDPIRFNLLFERFINPGRKDLPDADLDFMSERRHEVIGYLQLRYGAPNVGGISNYNTLNSASALRDVGKAIGVPDRDMEVSKLVPKTHGQPVSLEDARAQVAEIENYGMTHPEAWDVSVRLQGALRNLGQHAAGVVVCHEPLTERAVVATSKTGDQCINWDKRVSEEQGLVKIDILGLSNLDVIERAFRKIEHDTGKKVDILDIPLDDPKVLKAFAIGDTVGVFQFESSGMRKLLKDLAKGGDLTFEELSAAMALFRPGPLDSGMLDDYVTIRQGIMDPDYEHPDMAKALSVTNGVAVYQEQVMQLARDIAGFTLQEADDLRKAMGKKDKIAMAEQRDKWVDGCVTTSGLSKLVAGMLFDKVEAFAGYGFNRSHSIEYSIISFVSMWLKVYYPLQFYAASLEILGEDKLAGLVEDASKRGIQVLPPDINISDGTFKRDGSGKNLTCPFNRLKGLSELTQQAILMARAAGPFTSKADFIARVERRRCNSRHVGVLEAVGAFASVEPTTASADSPTRTKDQIELMPGLISKRVNIGREVLWDDFTKEQISKLVVEPSMKITAAPVMPRVSRKVKAMVITDAATKWEEKAGRVMEGDTAGYIKEAIAEAGGKWNNGYYYTTLCKAPKKDKKLSAEELRNWMPILKKEIEVIQPPIIVAMGPEVARMLVSDIKGPWSDYAGKVIYNKELDANVVMGITPGMIYIDASKTEVLNKVFEVTEELMS